MTCTVRKKLLFKRRHGDFQLEKLGVIRAYFVTELKEYKDFLTEISVGSNSGEERSVDKGKKQGTHRKYW